MKILVLFLSLAWMASCTNSGSYIAELLSQDNSNTAVADISAKCGLNCQRLCKEVFSDEDDRDQCMEFTYSEVKVMDRVKNKMRQAKWDSINVKELEAMIQVSHTVWVEYAGKNEISAKEMLIWIAEEEGVSDLLDSDGEVLKEAFSALSLRGSNQGVIDGLTKLVSDARTFLELSAWEQNKQAFESAHEVILDVCSDKKCVEQIYCVQSSDIVINMINELDLAGDIVSGADEFQRGFCS